MKNLIKSEFLKLNKRDFIRGLIISICSACFTALKLCIDTHGLDITFNDFKMIVASIISSFLGYLTLNLFTNSQGNFKPEEK